MIFSQALNFSMLDMISFQNITISSKNIQYTLDMFDITYENMSSNSYRIKLKPKSYIFLYNATFTVVTIPFTSPGHYSKSGLPFKI
jgi:hypothetical protein